MCVCVIVYERESFHISYCFPHATLNFWGSRQPVSTSAIEGIFHYNIEGRSATDSGDQARRKMAMAERRIERAGHKGIAFVFDVLFSNGAVIKRELQPTAMKRSVLDNNFTKVSFCMNYANAVLGRGISFRKRFSAPLALAKLITSPESASSVLGKPRSYVSPPHTAPPHTLVDTAAMAKAERKCAMEDAYRKRDRRGQPPNIGRKQPRRGLCGEYDGSGKFQRCGLSGYSPSSTLFCVQCKRYFHLPCFMDCHKCHLMQ